MNYIKINGGFYVFDCIWGSDIFNKWCGGKGKSCGNCILNESRKVSRGALVRGVYGIMKGGTFIYLVSEEEIK